ncbi:MAG TPA: hypothetical protein VFU91_05265 [Sphingomicrobium sp.]|jgi:hypothetical protein|nr:hypothetical protein [Sphingomicrobium sp.]
MTVDELKRSLADLLSHEECGVVDWERVQDLSIELLTKLRVQEGLDYPPEIVITYLTSFEMRRINGDEAGRQHATLTAYLRGPIS